MNDNTKYVGLDVSKEKIAVAVAEEGRNEPQYMRSGACGIAPC
ncbi:hypothetical protein [Sporolactobacillus inulinus]|jgi:hypothetical protein|nr:hypothetical protein [Sporolactobacillus inulinus]GEB76913.1 hypothetical protein SIN01_12580 [Sporolactobacillus inulinus]